MRRLFLIVCCILWAAAASPSRAAEPADTAPRTAVISAFEPELAALAAAATNRRDYLIDGARFTTGELEGKRVVLFLSGVSMVNAAMTTQRAIDHFNIQRIVFSGIAGGVDPSLDVGDVVVAEQWAQYLESVMAREVAPGQYDPADRQAIWGQPLGMMYPRQIEVARAPGPPEHRTWFPTDPAMLATARRVAAEVKLKPCVDQGLCLAKPPRVVVGGNGVSGPAFVDNAALRSWAYATFQARVLDMESAAVAQVAYSTGKPFIAFRSLSDLAGGDPGKNQARVFFRLASENSAAVVRAFLRASP